MQRFAEKHCIFSFSKDNEGRLKVIAQLQDEVGGAGVDDELLRGADGGTVEVIGVAEFGGELKTGRDGGACQQHEAHATTVVHGEREIVAHLALVEVETTIVVVGVEEGSGAA